MNINARINWKPGLELTSTLMKKWDESVSERCKALARIFHAGACLFPDTRLDLSARFVRKNLEIEIHDCKALLPSGRIIEIEEAVAIPMDSVKEDGNYFVCATAGDIVDYEQGGVTMSCRQIRFEVLDGAEAGKGDFLPLLKLKVEDQTAEIDQNFIVPSLVIASDPKLVERKNHMVERLKSILDHPNLEEGYCKRALHKSCMILEHVAEDKLTLELMRMCVGNIVELLDYYFVKSASLHEEFVSYDSLNISGWVDSLEVIFDTSVTMLDNYVAEDNSIDVEALKREIHDSLKTEMETELTDAIDERMRNVENALTDRLSSELRTFVSGELADMLHERLRVELDDELRDSLYKSLYDALYDALFIPEKERDVFMPII